MPKKETPGKVMESLTAKKKKKRPIKELEDRVQEMFQNVEKNIKDNMVNVVKYRKIFSKHGKDS